MQFWRAPALSLEVVEPLAGNQEMKRFSPELLCILSAIILGFSLPPFDHSYLAWIALVPLFFALDCVGVKRSTWLGFLFGAILALIAYRWVFALEVTNIISYPIWLFGLCSFYGIFGLAYSRMRALWGGWGTLAAPAIWTGIEYLRLSISFLSWPWNLLGHTQYSTLSLIQISDLTGVSGISFVIVACNFGIFNLVKSFYKVNGVIRFKTNNFVIVNSIFAAMVLCFTLVYGLQKLFLPESKKTVRVSIVQGNRLLSDGMSNQDQKSHLFHYAELTKRALMDGPKLVVWPSSSMPGLMGKSLLTKMFIEYLTKGTNAKFLLGSAGPETTSISRNEGELPYSNSEFLVASPGLVLARYDKILLLPFNEYIPLKNVFNKLEILNGVKDDFIPGEEYTLFNVDGVLFAAPICWENLFGDHFRLFVLKGAQFMVSATNEGFFGDTAAPRQALAMNVFRAVENRISVVRAASTGISAFIAPTGQIVERVHNGTGRDLFVDGVITRDVSVSTSTTFYTRHGEIFGLAMFVGTLLLVIISFCLCRNGDL